MELEQSLSEASRALRHRLETVEIPPPPGPTGAAPGWKRPPVVRFAAVAALVLFALFLYTRDSSEILVAGPPDPDLIVPLDDIARWTYDVGDIDSGLSLDAFSLDASAFAAAPSSNGRLGLRFSSLEPWRAPTNCIEIQSLLLPSATEIRSPGSAAQEIRARCDGVEMVGAARITWASLVPLSISSGEFEAIRIDVEITGFVDPFPLSLAVFIDPSVGIVRHEVIGSSPSRHVRADLTHFELVEE